MKNKHFKNNLINNELNKIADMVGVNKSKFKRKLKTFNKKDLVALKEALGKGNLEISIKKK